jgi:hypothetical protein
MAGDMKKNRELPSSVQQKPEYIANACAWVTHSYCCSPIHTFLSFSEKFSLGKTVISSIEVVLRSSWEVRAHFGWLCAREVHDDDDYDTKAVTNSKPHQLSVIYQ